MDAVAAYLGLPPIQVYEVARLLLDVRDEALRPPPHLGVHQHLCMLCGGETILEHVERRLGVKVAKARPTAASSSRPRRSAWRPATARR